MTRDTAAERRQAPRVDARLPLQLTEPDTRLVVTTESLDLSRNGLACRTGEYLAPLSKVAVTVILPPFGNLSRASRSLRAEGVVVRCEQTAQTEDAEDREYDLACCFTALEPDARNLLDAFVAWRLLRSVRSEEPRPSASHGSSGHSAHGRGGAPHGRFGRPRPGGRPSGPRQGRGDFRGSRSGGGSGGHASRDGARHERGGQGYGPRRSSEGGQGYPRGERSERGDRRDRGRPSRHPRQGGGRPGYVGSDRPREERPYEERSHGGEKRQSDRRERGHQGAREGRGHEARGHESGSGRRESSSGRGDRPPRGRFRREGGPRSDRGPRGRGRPGPRSSHERGRRDEGHPAGDRELRPRSSHEAHPRPERETTERGEGSPREEKRGSWGRRPARRSSPHARKDDSDTRRR